MSCALDPAASADEDLAMANKRTWFVIAGAVVGAAIGIVVSMTTDVPLAPEAGLLLGASAGWLWTRFRAEQKQP
jgi:F0F1-type ATP synthase assembly protein I